MEKIVPQVPEEYYLMHGQAPESSIPEVSDVEKLMNTFKTHEDEERTFVHRYREIAEKSDNPFVKFVLQLIISDEEKHHAITQAIVSTLRGSLNWSRPKNALSGLYDLGEKKEELLKVTEDFLRLENEGLKDYTKLTKESEHYYQGLFGLLLRCMVRDSEKHVEILKFLRDRLKEA